MFAVIVIAALVFNYAVSEQVDFRECKGGNTVLGVVINPCNSADHEGFSTCILRHEDKIRVEAAILAPFSGTQFETVATATINGHVIPFINSGSNPCQGSITPPCPVKAGRLYILTFIFDVLKYYPVGYRVKEGIGGLGVMDINFAIKDAKSKKTLGCVKLPIIVQRNPQLTYKS